MAHALLQTCSWAGRNTRGSALWAAPCAAQVAAHPASPRPTKRLARSREEWSAGERKPHTFAAARWWFVAAVARAVCMAVGGWEAHPWAEEAMRCALCRHWRLARAAESGRAFRRSPQCKPTTACRQRPAAGPVWRGWWWGGGGKHLKCVPHPARLAALAAGSLSLHMRAEAWRYSPAQRVAMCVCVRVRFSPIPVANPDSPGPYAGETSSVRRFSASDNPAHNMEPANEGFQRDPW